MAAVRLARLVSPLLRQKFSTKNHWVLDYLGSSSGSQGANVTTHSGGMLPEPKKVTFGLPKIILTVLPGLYLGATISKEGAAFLEENDIFVPDEDDDED